MATPKPLKILLFGDIHSCWDDFDLPYYQSLKVDITLFTGDIGPKDRIHRIIQDLKAICPNSAGILGNHDGASMPHVIAEALGQDTLSRTFASGHGERVKALRQLMGEGDLGFRCRDLPELEVSLLGMRPHSTGGERHHFPYTLRGEYGVDDALAAHRATLDASQHRDVIFLGHNGPFGLGAEPNDPYGVDFRAGGGDLGDKDYAQALEDAKAQGKRVLLAIGGHMHDLLHRRSRHLGRRRTIGELGGTLVINPCQIPRIKREGRGSLHRHVEVLVERGAGHIAVEEVSWLPKRGEQSRERIFEGCLCQ